MTKRSTKKDTDRHSFTVNLNDEEKELIAKASRALGCPLATFMRMKALEAATAIVMAGHTEATQ